MPPSNDKRSELESIRGLAAIVVVISHHLLMFAPQFSRELLLPGFGLWHHADFAVRIFFVLSGYVLTRKYFQTGAIAVLASGAVRRYPRLLLPILGSTLLGYGLYAGGFMAHRTVADIQGRPMDESDWVYVHYRYPPSLKEAVSEAAIRSYIGHYAPNTYNSSLWTMEVEFFGSLFAFALAALVGRLRNRWLLYVVIAVVLERLQAWYFIDFLAGVAFCDLLVHRASNWKFAAALLPFGLILGDCTQSSIPISDTPRLPHLMSTVAAAAVIAGATLSPFWRWVLSFRPFVFLGNISFCLYLFHIPILYSLGTMLFCYCHSQGLDSQRAALISATCSIAASIATAHLGTITLDRWSIRLASQLDSRIFRAVDKSDLQPMKLAS